MVELRTSENSLYVKVMKKLAATELTFFPRTLEIN